jgi:hypothetical protein
VQPSQREVVLKTTDHVRSALACAVTDDRMDAGDRCGNKRSNAIRAVIVSLSTSNRTEAVSSLSTRSCMIDGEASVVDENGLYLTNMRSG